MVSWLLKQLNKVPQPWRLILFVGIVIAALVIVFTLFSQISSCRYDKARKEFEEKEKAWTVERTKLITNAEAKERRVEELESQNAAFRAAAEQGKKVDDALAAKIDQVSKEAADEAARTDLPDDCWNRADRTCAKLAKLKPPIIVDCDEYKRKLCAR